MGLHIDVITVSFCSKYEFHMKWRTKFTGWFMWMRWGYKAMALHSLFWSVCCRPVAGRCSCSLCWTGAGWPSGRWRPAGTRHKHMLTLESYSLTCYELPLTWCSHEEDKPAECICSWSSWSPAPLWIGGKAMSTSARCVYFHKKL